MEQPKRAAVDVITGNHVVAGVEDVEQGVLGGHTTRERQPMGSAVQ